VTVRTRLILNGLSDLGLAPSARGGRPRSDFAVGLLAALILVSGSRGVATAQGAQAVRVPPVNLGPTTETGGTGAASTNPPSSTTPRYGPPESVRQRDAQMSASVPAQYKPPTGMCRVWVQGVPPAQQPAPTECAKAVRVRSPNSQVVFGSSSPGSPHPGGGVVAATEQVGGDRMTGGQTVETQAVTVTHAAVEPRTRASVSATTAPPVTHTASRPVVHSAPPPPPPSHPPAHSTHH
jgi:hypothetical protein